jgi:hypothetical protein
MRHVNKAARMSLHHRMIQHRSAIRWVEARTLASERVFPRHSHDQLGIGIMVSCRPRLACKQRAMIGGAHYVIDHDAVIGQWEESTTIEECCLALDDQTPAR